MSPTVVRMEHCRKLMYCSRGVRELLGRYGFDYSEFLVNGVDAQALLEASNNDSMVAAVVEVARGEEEVSNGRV